MRARLRELSFAITYVFQELGRAEAGLAAKSRPPVMTSPHFVSQYFTSFSEDPILKSIEKESEADVDEKITDSSQGYEAARECLKARNAKGSFLKGKVDLANK